MWMSETDQRNKGCDCSLDLLHKHVSEDIKVREESIWFKHSGALNSFYGCSVTVRCWLVLLFIFLKMMVLHKLCYFCFDVYSRLFYLRQMDDSKRERERRIKWVPGGEGMFFLPYFTYIFLCFPVLLLSCSRWGLFHNTRESSAYLFPLPY